MKSLKIRLAQLVISLLISFPQLTAQTEKLTTEEPQFKHAIGAGIGYVTGYGLSYRYTPNKFGVQVNFAPYHSNDLDRYSLGLTFMYTMVKNRISSLFIYQGNHYYYNSEMVAVYENDPNKPYNPNPTMQRITDGYVNNGLGFGIEVTIAKRIGFNLMGGYAVYDNFKNVNLTGETALYYKF
jgi:hypothetical protein